MIKKQFLPMIILLALLLGLFAVGCGNQDVASTDLTSEKTSPVALSYQVYTETIKDETDGTDLLSLKITYPVLDNPEKKSGIAAINEYFGDQFDDFISQIFSEGVANAKEIKAAAQSEDFPFHPHSYDRSVSIDYNGNNLLSVHYTQSDYTGGAHPNTIMASATFDVTTGQKLALTDILGCSQEEALEKVYQTVFAQIEAKQGTEEFVFNDNYQEDVRQYYNAEDFGLTGNSLRFYYQLYTIAPYVAGIQIFDLPLNQAGELAINIPELQDNELEKELYPKANKLIAHNLAALKDIFVLSMLELEIPENYPEGQVLFPVKDETFTSFAKLEDFVRSTYVQKEADALLNNGMYQDVDGKLYGDISKAAGIGYYVNWNKYRFVLSDITANDATLTLYTTEDSPAGQEEITITVKLVKEKDIWLLNKLFS